MERRTKINVRTAKKLQTSSVVVYHLCIDEGLTT